MKNDRIDLQKIAVLLRGGMIPHADVYPERMRATRDLLRRRLHLMRFRADSIAHIQNTASQYNLPPLAERASKKSERPAIPAHFPDPVVRQMIQLDLEVIAHLVRTVALKEAKSPPDFRGRHGDERRARVGDRDKGRGWRGDLPNAY